MGYLTGLDLEEGGHAGEHDALLLLVHVLHLVGHVVDQLLRRLHRHLPAAHRSQAPPAPSSERASERGSERGS
eukprot:SAG11_NODE_9037_length_950_cov_1.491187_1_plen_72_part_10